MNTTKLNAATQKLMSKSKQVNCQNMEFWMNILFFIYVATRKPIARNRIRNHQNQETKRDGGSHPCIQLLETRFVLGLFSFQKKEPDFSVCCLSSLPPPFCTGLVLFIKNRIARHTENAKHLMYGNPRFFGCAKEKSETH
jgi:hypothetical protein